MVILKFPPLERTKPHFCELPLAQALVDDGLIDPESKKRNIMIDRVIKITWGPMIVGFCYGRLFRFSVQDRKVHGEYLNVTRILCSIFFVRIWDTGLGT